MREEQEEIFTKVLLVGVDTGEEQDFEHTMEELASLAEAAYKQVAGVIVQRMDAVNKALYIGTGKASEVREYAAQCGAEEIVFDNALSPSQVRNLGRELELPILDRTNLILDIFSIRAKTKEARLQVETAKLQYMLPRLVGMRENLSRQGGTGGSMSNKGAGETKLELDRRKIGHRISELKKELEQVSRTRETMRKRRGQSRIPQVALVGYTNAGKSTIMNRLVEQYGESRDKTVLEKDMLFATLDTSVRSIHTGDNKPFFLVDTVGFIHKLPHGLIEAFHSTLEEVRYADLVVQVVDFSDEYHRQQAEVTEGTLRELKAADIPRIVVYN
ncbi:MAG: GTPase HflX, partial [Acetatifactor sp.]|nr:GTPase HflX [Acetatifactor sp.]